MLHCESACSQTLPECWTLLTFAARTDPIQPRSDVRTVRLQDIPEWRSEA